MCKQWLFVGNESKQSKKFNQSKKNQFFPLHFFTITFYSWIVSRNYVGHQILNNRRKTQFDMDHKFFMERKAKSPIIDDFHCGDKKFFVNSMPCGCGSCTQRENRTRKSISRKTLIIANKNFSFSLSLSSINRLVWNSPIYPCSFTNIILLGETKNRYAFWVLLYLPSLRWCSFMVIFFFEILATWLIFRF